MNANMNRLMLAVLGGIAGISLAIILSPSSRKDRERIGKMAGEMGETVREGLRTRLRATPLMETGQEMARLISERAQEAAHRAQEAATRMRGAATGGTRAAGETAAEAAGEALEQAREAAMRALDAVEALVKRTENVIEDSAKTRKID